MLARLSCRPRVLCVPGGICGSYSNARGVSSARGRPSSARQRLLPALWALCGLRGRAFHGACPPHVMRFGRAFVACASAVAV